MSQETKLTYEEVISRVNGDEFFSSLSVYTLNLGG